MKNVMFAAAVALCGMLLPAQAQQQGTPEMQALQGKLLQEFNGGLVCTAEKILVQEKLATAERQLAATVKELEHMKGLAEKPPQ